MANELFQTLPGGGAAIASGNAVPATHVLRAFNNSLSIAGGYGTQTDVSTTGTTNNLSPATAALHQVWTGGSSWTITGQVPLQNGQIQTYTNAGTANLRFTHQDVNSTAANRFILRGASALNVPPGASVTFRYDGTASRWRPIAMSAGAVYDGVTVTLANGRNDNVGFGNTNFVRSITGPTAVFQISGIVPEAPEGQRLAVMQNTGFALTFNHNDVNSSAANRIFCPGSVNKATSASFGTAELIYDGLIPGWVLLYAS